MMAQRGLGGTGRGRKWRKGASSGREKVAFLSGGGWADFYVCIWILYLYICHVQRERQEDTEKIEELAWQRRQHDPLSQTYFGMKAFLLQVRIFVPY